METIHLKYPHELEREQLPKVVTAIGFFDGIHKGHQKVIQTAIDKAKELNMLSAVITFYPHPSVVLKVGQQHATYITPLVEKEEILNEMGVDRLFIIEFNEELSKVYPKDFIEHFIIGLNVRHLVAGFDFSYGYKGQGSMKTIGEHAENKFTYTTIEKLTDNNEKVSSTLVRECMKNGELEKCNHLLGRPLSIRGKVIEGDKRGRTIGFPTANIQPSDLYLLPKVGVYAVSVNIDGEERYGMANLGYKPTFHSEIEKPVIEVHIFDYNNDLYGKELIVQWHKFIREEKKFQGIEQLVDQIKSDEKEIRSFFNVK